MSFLFDTPISFLIRSLGAGKFLSFPEEQANYDLDVARRNWDSAPNSPSRTGSTHSSLDRANETADTEKRASNYLQDEITVVGWYGDDDPSNPQNWSFWKKFRIFFTIDYVSTAVYMSGSIYAAAQEEVVHVFHTSSTVASLGLGLYVLGYGLGPMVLSPPSELPGLGRNILYLSALAIYVLISIPTALVQNLPALLVLRFLQGFFGSPVLVTGGATLGDISSEFNKPYALYSWAMFSLAGPALGITIAGFSTPVLGGRFSLWEIMLATGPGLILLLFLPETSHDNILLRRAQRIRTLSKNDAYRSHSELDLSTQATLITRFYRSLIVPRKLNLLDPSIAFTSIYCGLVYAMFYSFFEFFPLVYGNIYGMSLSSIGLVFISVILSVGIAFIPYSLFVHYVVNKSIKAGNPPSPEDRLLPALVASVLIPIGLFIFGWTSRRDIHWVVPTLGTMLVSGNVVVIIQCIFVYITQSYPQYTASLLSGNGFVRSAVAFAGILWSSPMYENLGVGWSMTILGCCCAVCISGIFVLYRFGKGIRKRSKFTE